MMDLTDYKPGLVKSKDVCRMLAICPRTLKEYIDDGRIKAYRLPGGHFRFRFPDVLGLLQFSEGDPTPFDDSWNPERRRDAQQPTDRATTATAGTPTPQGLTLAKKGGN